MADKPLVWVGSSLERLRAFPPEAMRVAGFELRRVQGGLDPHDWKPLRTVAPGICEIRIHTDLEHRVVYVAKFLEAVYVLHAFEKRTGRTPRRELSLITERYAEVLHERLTR